MLQQPAFTKSTLGYEEIGHRVQRIIADPKSQRVQFAKVARLPTERPEDWRRLVEEISNTPGIRVQPLEEDVVRIGWREYCEA